VSECLYYTPIIEDNSRELVELEEVVEPEGSLEDLIEVENSLLQDAQLGIVRCLLSSPILSDEWSQPTIFYTIVKCKETLIYTVIDGGSTMNVITQSVRQRCHMKVEHHPHPFKVEWVNKANLTITYNCKVPI